MYNSRPRYPAYKNYSYTSDFSVPENYSGNAFRGDVSQKSELRADTESEIEMERMNEIDEDMPDGVEGAVAPEEAEYTVQDGAESVETMGRAKEEHREDDCHVKQKAGFGFDMGKLLGGGIGFEEILIIGLMLLVGKEGGNEDIIILLALLLFIG